MLSKQFLDAANIAYLTQTLNADYHATDKAARKWSGVYAADFEFNRVEPVAATISRLNEQFIDERRDILEPAENWCETKIRTGLQGPWSGQRPAAYTLENAYDCRITPRMNSRRDAAFAPAAFEAQSSEFISPQYKQMDIDGGRHSLSRVMTAGRGPPPGLPSSIISLRKKNNG